jgi:hypothetical protein
METLKLTDLTEINRGIEYKAYFLAERRVTWMKTIYSSNIKNGFFDQNNQMITEFDFDEIIAVPTIKRLAKKYFGNLIEINGVVYKFTTQLPKSKYHYILFLDLEPI